MINMLRRFQIVIIAVVFTNNLIPCSTFSVTGVNGTYLGKNFDFTMGHGIIVNNKRNVHKMGLPNQMEYLKYAAEWKSKYGSMTFNQIARELPYGGMNEKGLAVEQMWLLGGGYSIPDGRPVVNELQWIQYQLDNFATVQEVIHNINNIQILATASELHYILCDSSGDCALIDYIKGKPVIYYGSNFNNRVSTNTPYDSSLKGELKNDMGFLKNFGWKESIQRFNKLKNYRHDYDAKLNEEDSVKYVFVGLDKVNTSQIKPPFWVKVYGKIRGFFSSTPEGKTHWQIVYNTKNKEIYFKTAANNRMKTFKLDQFNFSCKAPVKVLDIDYDKSGDIVTYFHDYSRVDNSRIVNTSLDAWDTLPKKGRDFLIDLPEKLECSETGIVK